ncbi:MAG TPA: VWA domain-containing protein [Terracidiphilus sp.]|nr:VWA domain-containing protein [Terracidiphilus sp.]
MKLGLTAMALAALLSFNLNLSPAARAQQQPAPVPDAPAPQTPKLLTDLNGPVTPGLGAGDEQTSPSSTSDSPSQQPAPSTQAPPSQVQNEIQKSPPQIADVDTTNTLIHLNVTYVQVPVTVKDPKGNLVAGLTWRDFKIYENNTREDIKVFNVDPYPLSIAFVVDQSLTSDVMDKVNNSLDAIQGALTPYDELSVFTYSNGSQNPSHGFTGAQSARAPFVLSMVKSSGTDEQVPVNSGPLSGCPIRVNGSCADPTIQPGFSAGSASGVITIPKEIHTLNDAILAAAKELASRPKERRRIIYVISDGKEYGSKASLKEVIRFLQTNEIAVYGTLVGTSAAWGEGWVSKVHLPFTMYDNILYKYIAATGGQADSERNLNGIEKSYADIAKQARNQYLLVYASHESVYDSKYRKIDVRVDRPGLDVTAKQGYFPSAQMSAP